jgi:hypothetical protein
MEGTIHSSSNATDVDIPPEAQPPAPAATLVKDMDMSECSAHDRTRDLTGMYSFLAGAVCMRVVQMKPVRGLFWVKEWKIYPKGVEEGFH